MGNTHALATGMAEHAVAVAAAASTAGATAILVTYAQRLGDDVNKTAHHNDEIKNVPRFTKIILQEEKKVAAQH